LRCKTCWLATPRRLQRQRQMRSRSRSKNLDEAWTI
jgi:hypothetical protein